MNLREYQDFVQKVTSRESDSLPDLVRRLESLADANTPLLLTAAIGLSSETGEFNEIVKKIVFQGKPLTGESVHHMKRELGDILWYWVNACRALGLDPNEVLAENVAKLGARYPGLVFSTERSENRAKDDL
jgi:NTP pyrophosphatase (non-canonical NTP hydrolase)